MSDPIGYDGSAINCVRCGERGIDPGTHRCPQPEMGATGTCRQCGRGIRFSGRHWEHTGGWTPRHIAVPVEWKRPSKPLDAPKPDELATLRAQRDTLAAEVRASRMPMNTLAQVAEKAIAVTEAREATDADPALSALVRGEGKRG